MFASPPSMAVSKEKATLRKVPPQSEPCKAARFLPGRLLVGSREVLCGKVALVVGDITWA